MNSSTAVTVERFTVQSGGRSVPGLVWFGREAPVPGSRPLVLLGHGGGGDKEAMAGLADQLVQRAGVVVAAIDGPVHGDRRSDGAPREVVLEEFRALWRNGTPMIDEMVDDWSVALRYLVELEQVDPSRVAWCGLSMGTAYGVPVVAAHPQLAAAAFGMWGLSYPSSQRLADDAPKISCPLLFQRKLDDALFTADGQEALFALFGSSDKSLVVYPGPHETSDAQVDDIIQFLCKHLTIGDLP